MKTGLLYFLRKGDIYGRIFSRPWYKYIFTHFLNILSASENNLSCLKITIIPYYFFLSSVRRVKRDLQRLHLTKRKNIDPVEVVRNAVQVSILIFGV